MFNGHEILARHAGNGGEHPGLIHAAGAQLAFDHGAAGAARFGAFGGVVDFAHAITSSGYRLYCTHNTLVQSPKCAFSRTRF